MLNIYEFEVEYFKIYFNLLLGILDVFKEWKFVSLMGLEGGYFIDSSFGNLCMFYNLGIWYMIVIYSCNILW